MSTIDFRHVCKRFASAALTINDANLRVERGEFCVFVGPSGCGKSTLLRLVAGLEEITSGEIAIDGVRINEMPPARRGVAMVFQSYALYPHMTVLENMAFGIRVLGADQQQIDAKVKQAAEILQLTHLLDRLPKQLSGGQRQRVAIGRAIVKEPRVFLFDEPLSNLDAALRVQTRLEIAKLHRQIGSASMIYVTHDQVEAMTLADKIVLLHAGADVQTKGSVAQIGSPLTLYHQPASRFVAEFIGSPKMNVLPATLVDANPERAQLRVGAATLTARVDATALAPQASVWVGLRPECIDVVADGVGGNVIMGQLSHIEKLGDSSLLYVELAGDLPLLTVKVDGTSALSTGDTIRLRPDAAGLHLFGPDGRACPRTVAIAA